MNYIWKHLEETNRVIEKIDCDSVEKMVEIFGKSTSPRDFVVLGGPAGGSALERASPPTDREEFQKERDLYIYFIQQRFFRIEFTYFFAGFST